MLKKHSDKKLLEGLKKGDDKSVNYLYDSFFDTIRKYVLKNSGTEDDAYDIFQEAMMVLFKKIQQNHLDESTHVKAYIYGVSRNLWHENLRKRKITLEVDDKYEAEDYNISSLLDIPLEQIVQKGFIKLKPECQQVLKMVSEGKSYSEIAKAMNYKSADYAKRKKFLCKEELLKIIKSDPDYSG